MGIVVEVIAEYLLSNRRLVVPAFGAFMVKESGERLFSDLLKSDDGVLASLLRARGLSEMETAVTIDRFVFEVRYELEEYGYCRLGEVGTLRVEPSTKSLRLYPPVQGELPKQKPYVPHPVTDERREARGESETPSATLVPLKPDDKNNENEEQRTDAPATPVTPKKSTSAAKPRKKFDFVMVAAVVIVVVALAAIAYGWYVSNLSMEDDDAAMDALRVTPGQMVNE